MVLMVRVTRKNNRKGVRAQLDFLCEVKNKKIARLLCIKEIGNILLIRWCIVLCLKIIFYFTFYTAEPPFSFLFLVLLSFFFEVILFISVFHEVYFKSAFPLSTTFFFMYQDFILGNWGVLKPGIFIFIFFFFLFILCIRIIASFFYRQRK